MKSKIYKHDFQTFIGDLNGVNKIDQSLTLPERFAVRSSITKSRKSFNLGNLFYGLMILSTGIWLARFMIYPLESVFEILIGGLVIGSNLLLSKLAKV